MGDKRKNTLLSYFNKKVNVTPTVSNIFDIISLSKAFLRIFVYTKTYNICILLFRIRMYRVSMTVQQM